MDDRSIYRPAGRNTPVVPPDEETSVTPLPPLMPEDQIPDLSPEQAPVFPPPPIDSAFSQPPVFDPGQIPVVPLPPVIIAPDSGYSPQFPPAPGGVILLPNLISPSYCTVRILNAAPGFEPFHVRIGSRQAVRNLTYGSMSSYIRVADGFRTVTISYPGAMGALYQQEIPFNAGELLTLAVVRSGSGLDLVRISDMPCRNRPTGRACIRAVNLCYGSPALDVLLSDGRMVFSDVRYKDVTHFKQARPRDYSFYIAQTSYIPSPFDSDIRTLEDAPVSDSGYFPSGFGGVTPLVSFYVDAKRNGVYSIYLLGAWNHASPSLQASVVEDFQ